MPFSRTSITSHNDERHYGSAKRDTAGGLAALSAGGSIMGKANNVQMVRDGSGDIAIIERTSAEFALTIRRNAANDYSSYNSTVAGGKLIQDSSMKNIASGIAGLDAAAKLAQAQLPLLTVYANNAAAVGGGLVVGNFYRNGADPDMVCVVH